MARPLDRLVVSFAPTLNLAGQRQPLPLGLMAVGYKIRATGTLTVGSAAVTLVEDSPYGLISQAQLVLGGSYPLRQADARFWRFWNRYQHFTDNRFTQPSPAAAAVTNFVAEFSIDIEQPELLPPLDRAFWMDSRRLARVEMVFDVGGDGDVTSVNTGTANAFSALNIQVRSKEIQDRAGITSRMQLTRNFYPSLATGDNDMQLTALGAAYRAIILHFVSGNATYNRATSDDTFGNTVTLAGDQIRYWDAVPYSTLQQEDKQQSEIEAWPPGFVVLDAARSRNLQDLVQTGNRRSLVLRTNLTSVPSNAQIGVYLANVILVASSGGQIVGPQARRPVAVSGRR
jgi:hypothetical protein